MSKIIDLSKLERYDEKVKEYIKNNQNIISLKLSTNIEIGDSSLNNDDIEYLDETLSNLSSGVYPVSLIVNNEDSEIYSNVLYGNLLIDIDNEEQEKHFNIYVKNTDFDLIVDLYNHISEETIETSYSCAFISPTKMAQLAVWEESGIYEYMPDQEYNKGDYVYHFINPYEGHIYRCNEDITVPEEFDEEHWTQKTHIEYLREQIVESSLNKSY